MVAAYKLSCLPEKYRFYISREILNNPAVDYRTKFVYRMAFGLPLYSLYKLKTPLELDRVLVDVAPLIEGLEAEREDDVEALMAEVKRGAD